MSDNADVSDFVDEPEPFEVRRSATIAVRFSENELRIVRQRAAYAGLDVPAFIRSAVGVAGERPSVLLARHRQKVLDLIAQHRGSNARMFGSVARGDDTEDSDLDLLVTFEPDTHLGEPGVLIAELQALLGVSVDVVSEDALTDDRFSARVRREAIPVASIPAPEDAERQNWMDASDYDGNPVPPNRRPGFGPEAHRQSVQEFIDGAAWDDTDD